MTALLYLSLLWAIQGADAAPGEPVIQRLFVPRERLGDFLPKDEITHLRTEEELDRLIETFRARRAEDAPRRPHGAKLEASFDPSIGRLTGKGTWSIPAGASSIAVFEPWSLTLKSLSSPSRILAQGFRGPKELVAIVEETRPLSIEMDWELSALPRENGWRLEAGLPNAAISELTIAIPDGWAPRVSHPPARSLGNGLYLLPLGGVEGFAVELARTERRSSGKEVLAWQANHRLRVDDRMVEESIDIRFESLHEPLERISILVEESFVPREMKWSTPAQWRQEEAGDGLTRWIAEFRRPPLGPFRLDIRASTSTAPGVPLRPTPLVVERALPRGETIVFSFPKGVGIQSVNRGQYEQLPSSSADEGRFELVFAGPGLRRAKSSELLDVDDMLDWTSLARRLKDTSTSTDPSLERPLLQALPTTLRDALLRSATDGPLEPTRRTEIVSAWNAALARRDLFLNDPALLAAVESRGPRFALSPTPTPNEIARAQRPLFEEALAREWRSRRLERAMPEVVYRAQESETNVTQNVYFDLGRDQARLAAKFEWRCRRGPVDQPTVVVPPGWSVSSIETDPSSRLLGFRTEPGEKGSSVASLLLDRPLASGETLTGMILAESPKSVGAGTREETRLILPEMSALEPPSSGPSSYHLFVDPTLLLSKESLPPIRTEAGYYPWPKRPPTLEEYEFSYTAPLEAPALTLAAEQPRAAMEHVLDVAREADHWRVKARVDVTIEQGLVRSIEIRCKDPLPADLAWQVERGGNSLERVRRVAPNQNDKEPALHRYLLDLASPVGSTLSLSATWIDPNAECRVPLLAFPRASRFRSTIDVRGRRGEPIDVKVVGLTESTSPSRGVGDTGLIWSSSFAKLPGDARLTLAVGAGASADRAPVGASAVSAVVRSLIDPGRSVDTVSLSIDCRSPRGLRFPIPEGARLWRATLDGEAISPVLVDGEWELAPRLEPGFHSVELVLSRPLEAVAEPPHPTLSLGGERVKKQIQPTSWLFSFLPEIQLPGGWESLGSVWRVDQYGANVVLAGRGLASRGSIDSRPMTSSVQAADLAQALERAFDRLTGPERGSLISGVSALAKGLPPGAVLLIDRAALPAGDGEGDDRATTLFAWLNRWGLRIEVGANVVLIGQRAVVSARRGDGVEQSGVDWLEQAANAARREGEADGRRFVTPAVLAGSDEGSELASGMGAPGGEASLITSTFLREGASSNTPARVVILWRAGLTKVSAWLALVSAAALGFFFARRKDVSVRPMSVGALVGLIASIMMGSWVDALFTPIVLASLGVLGVVALARWWTTGGEADRARNGSVESVAACWFLGAIVAANAQGQAKPPPVSLESGRSFRVLIPLDVDPAEARPRQVVIPNALLEKLQTRDSRAHSFPLLRRLALQGEQTTPTEVRWKGQIELQQIPSSAFPQSVSLPFADIVPLSVRWNGASRGFLPPGQQSTLDVALSQRVIGPIEIDFLTVAGGSAERRDIEFSLPLAPQTSVSLKLFPQASGLAFDPPSSAWRVETDKDKVLATGTLGSLSRLRAQWRDARSVQGAAVFDTTSAVLVDLTPTTRDWAMATRVEVASGAVSTLSLLLPADMVVRRIEAASLAHWTWDDAQGNSRRVNLRFDPPLTKEGLVKLYAMTPATGGIDVHLAAIEVEKGRGRRGIVAVRAPAGAQLSHQRWSRVRPATTLEFADEWKSLGNPPAESLLVAHRFVDPFEADLRIERESPTWNGRQQVTMQLSPYSRAVSLAGSIAIERGGAELGLIRARLPLGLSIERVEGEGLLTWTMRGSLLSLFLDRAGPLQLNVRFTGQWTATDRSVNVRGIDWLGAQKVEQVWRWQAPAHWKVAITKTRQATLLEPLGGVEVVRSEVADHQFKATLAPMEPEWDVRSTLLVAVQRDEIAFDGRFDFLLTRGAPAFFQFRSALGDEDIRWQGNIASATSEAKSDHRLWTVRLARPSIGRFPLDWRLTRPRPEQQPLAVPTITLVGQPSRERWVMVNNPSDSGVSVDVGRGLAPGEPPTENLAWAEGANRPSSASGRGSGYRIEQDDWRLTLSAKSSSEPPIPMLVRRGDLEMRIGRDGSIHAASRWEVFDQFATNVNIELPSPALVDDLLIDGSPLAFPERTPKGLCFPLFRRHAWQEIVLYWSLPEKRPRERWVAVPQLVHPAEFPVLCRFGVPEGLEVASGGKRLDRAGWLLRRVDRALERLSDRLIEWDHSRTPSAEERAVEMIGRVRLLEAQWSEAVHASPEAMSEHSGGVIATLEALHQRGDDLLAKYQAEGLARRAASRQASSEEFARTLVSSPVDHHNYASLEAPARGVHVGRSKVERTFAYGRSQCTRLGTALLALALVLFPGLWPATFHYWPAPLLTVGIAWWRWSELPSAGLAMIGVALLASALLPRRWLVDDRESRA